MKILIPFTPHLAYECLELLGAKEIKKWPKIDTRLIEKEKIKMAVQINGKTRDVFEVNKSMNQTDIVKLCKSNLRVKSKIENVNIIKIIFVQDKIINFIIKE